MDRVELLRIILPLIVVFGMAAVLVGLVRRRNAARERALMEFADRYALKYISGGKDFYQGSWPGKVSGSYRGRKLTFAYRNDPKMTRQGYSRADYSAVLEIAVRNPGQGSLSLQARLRGKQTDGDLFDQHVTVSSRPQAFFEGLRIEAGLRQRLAGVLIKDWMNPGMLNVVRTGTLVFERPGIFYRSDDLAEVLDVLGDLADRVESRPGSEPAD
jgi:hypothetical protein